MPRIPIVTAQGKPAVFRAPGLPRGRPIRAPTFRAVTQFGQALGAIGDRLQRQKDELEVVEAVGQFEAAVADAKLQLAQNPNFALHGQQFSKDMARFIQGIEDTMLSSRVSQRAFRAHVARTLPVELVKVRANALALQTNNQLARIAKQAEVLSRQAVESATPEDRQEAVERYKGLIQGAVAIRQLTPLQGQKALQQFDEQVAFARALKDIDADAGKAVTALEAGAHPDLDPTARRQLITQAKAKLARETRLTREEEARLNREENVKFYRLLQDDKLTVADVTASPHLTRQDMNFFVGALTKAETPETDPETMIEIENTLDAPTKTRAEEIANAAQAKAMAEKAFLANKLKKEDALNVLRRANRVLAGQNLDSDRWFKLAKAFLRDKFGWQGGVVGRFLNPEGASKYWGLMSQLMAEQEAEPTGLSGKAVFDRAVDLAGPAAIDFWSSQAGGEPTANVQRLLPDAAENKGKTLLDTVTQRKYKSDGKKWNEVK